MDRMKSGTTAWSEKLSSIVTVEEIREMWGVKTIVVRDQSGNIFNTHPEDLKTLGEVKDIIASVNRISSIATCAKLDNHLNLPDSITAHISTGLEVLPHQIDHLEETLKRGITRFLLADEVGLGKTITAGMIITELRNRGLVERILVLSPSGIVPQWIQEMRNHFNMELTPLFTDIMPTPEIPEVWNRFDNVITSYDSVKPVRKRKGWTDEKIRKYNSIRFDALCASDWSMIIIDEAHRVAGSQVGVARYELARTVATTSPYMLLLSGTPHMGKPDQFLRLMQLLDPVTFIDLTSLKWVNIQKHLLRISKKRATTLEGKKLFVKRTTNLVSIPEKYSTWKHRLLYDKTTEYIKHGYELALNQNRKGLGFLMVMVQRMLSSSTMALEETLKKRMDFLKERKSGSMDIDEESLNEDSDISENSVYADPVDDQAEIKMIEELLDLINQCRLEGPDPKTRYLTTILRRIQQAEKDPKAKFLIFTEFHGTQKMLRDYLELHDYNVVILNGKMPIGERVIAQRDFQDKAQIMISTEAGGEGLNLQFAHIVVNYDLPWNPMRIEQRIGRVHRIGQKKPVIAINLAVEGTVEHRVVEILGKKLENILKEFQMDKLSDILDTPAIEKEVHDIYRLALSLDEEQLETEINKLIDTIKSRIDDVKKNSKIEDRIFDLDEIKKRISEPVDFWLERLSATYNDTSLSDIKNERTREIIRNIPPITDDVPIPEITSGSLSGDLEGMWSLWRVGYIDDDGNRVIRYRPLFYDEKGNLLIASANRIFDILISGSFQVERISDNGQKEIFFSSFERAKEELEQTFRSLTSDERKKMEDDNRRHLESFETRKKMIASLGLPEVRNYRMSKLEKEIEEWNIRMKRRSVFHPVLDCVLMLKVSGDSS